VIDKGVFENIKLYVNVQNMLLHNCSFVLMRSNIFMFLFIIPPYNYSFDDKVNLEEILEKFLGNSEVQKELNKIKSSITEDK
jgi:hypothetical protein